MISNENSTEHKILPDRHFFNCRLRSIPCERRNPGFLEDIISVQSHVEASKQCRNFFANNPDIEQIARVGTASTTALSEKDQQLTFPGFAQLMQDLSSPLRQVYRQMEEVVLK